MSNISKIFLIVLLIIFFSGSLFSQEKVNERLKDLKGKVEKIVIETDKGEEVFEGEDAEYLLKKMKGKFNLLKIDEAHSPKKVFFISEDADSSIISEKLNFSQGKQKVYLTDDDGETFNVWITKDDSDDSMEINKNVVVKSENGIKKVIVTSSKNGEEEVTVYTGEDADEFLKKEHGQKAFIFHSDDDDVFHIKTFGHHAEISDEKDMKIIKLKKKAAGDHKIDLKIEDDDGDLKVIITEEKDGEVSVKELRGEEAEKFLEEHEKGKVFITESDDDEIHVIVKKVKDAEDLDEFIWFEDEDEDGKQMKVEYVIEDGVKKLTVTTIENGEEKVETYEGEEAEKYIKKMEDEQDLKIKMSKEGKEHKIIIKKEKKSKED